MTDIPDMAALVTVLEQAIGNIRDLNMTEPDANGHRWAVSDLIEQECVFASTALSKLAAIEPGPGVTALVEALRDAEDLAHGMSFSESQIVATWGKAVEAKCRAALAALKPGAGT